MASPRRPLIVVVEDDAASLDLMRDILEAEAGCAVAPCRDASAACDVVRRARPDLVILDLLFAGQELGWTVLEQFRGDPATAAIPVLVCSAFGRTLREHRERLDRHGVRGLAKPFELDQLLEAVERELAGRGSGAPA
jgi:two-component system, OmpR family, response regulator